MQNNRTNVRSQLLGAATVLYVLPQLFIGCGGDGGHSANSASVVAPVVSGVQLGTLSGLTVQPQGPLTIDSNAAFQVIVDGDYVDAQGNRFVRDLTRRVTYSVADPLVAEAGSDGLVRARGLGTTQIDVELDGHGTSFDVTVVPPGSPVTLTRLQVLPPARTLADVAVGREQLQQMVVIGVDSSGRLHDLTRTLPLTCQERVSGASTQIASLSPSGLLRGVAQGEVVVSARQAQAGVAGSHVVLGPGQASPVDPATLYSGAPIAGSANPFDVAVLEYLIGPGTEPSALCTDGEFLRRLYTDACGRLPTEAETEAFLTNTAPDKRAQEIARILATREFADWWATHYPEWFHMGRGQEADDFQLWVADSLAGASTQAELFTQMIQGQVSPFNAKNPLPGDRVDEFLEVGAGMDVKCTRCHSHFLTGPTDEPFWTQENRFQLDAFFATTRDEATPHQAGLGGLRFGLPVGQPQQPGFVLDPTAVVTSQLSTPLAQRQTEFALLFTDSAAFARGLGHRVFMEILEPLLSPERMSYRAQIDGMAAPKVLDAIQRVFEQEGSSLQGFLGVLFRSSVYQLSSRTTDPTVAEVFATHPVRRHHAEVVIRALEDVTGHTFDQAEVDFLLKTFGAPPNRTQSAERQDDPNTSQALVLMNSALMCDAIGDPNGTAATLAAEVVARRLSEAEAVHSLFRHALSRDPDSQELSACLDTINQAASVREGLEDIVVALVTSAEFVMH
jgi:Protein of unknown function (DUF1549)/Protein of unknown function (DUF1553)